MTIVSALKHVSSLDSGTDAAEKNLCLDVLVPVSEFVSWCELPDGVGVPQCQPEFAWNPDAVVCQPVHLESRLLVDGVQTGLVVDIPCGHLEFRLLVDGVQNGLVADFPSVLVQPDHHLESRLFVDGVQHGPVVDSSCGLGSRHLADEVQHGLVVDLPSADILFLADVVGTIISPESGESNAQISDVFAGVSGFFDPMFDVSVASLAAHSPGAQPHCELVLPQVPEVPMYHDLAQEAGVHLSVEVAVGIFLQYCIANADCRSASVCDDKLAAAFDPALLE